MYKTKTFTDIELKEIQTYGVQYINTLVEKEKTLLENTFVSIGLQELVALIELKKLNNKQLGMAFRCVYFNTPLIANIIIWSIMSSISILSFLSMGFDNKSYLYGLISTLVIYVLYRVVKDNT